ncbi:MAG: S41 family peptidase [Candidatus Paceibacterota bacterium]
MKILTRLPVVTLLIVSATFLGDEILRTSLSTHGIALAFNDNMAACSIPTNEFVSLIQSINHAEENFLFGTEISVPRMWWGAILGLNNSLDEPLERKALEQRILQLREESRIIPELAIFLRIQEVRSERNAQDFFLLVSSLCQAGLITKAEIHTERAIRRAHASLGDPYSTYLTPAEAERYVLESVREMHVQENAVERTGFEYFVRLSENIYILRINSFFSQQVVSDVRSTLEKIVDECSFPNIILDLRNNLGGFTDASIGVSQSFLRNATIAQFEDREGLRESFVADNDDNNFHFKSITVLVNHETASAAEIVTAALGENGALIVGTETYGKAVGQRVQHLRNGWAARITSFRVYSPLGNTWQGTGITPEIDIETFVFTLDDEEEGGWSQDLLSTHRLDPLVLASYQLIRQRESWDPRCGP